MIQFVKRFSLLIIIFLSFSATSSGQPRHFVDVWGGGGYSRLNHGIENTKVPGGMGMNVGVGYELNINRFALQTGLEYHHFGSKTSLLNHSDTYVIEYIDPYSISPMLYHYSFEEYSEKHRAGYLQIPLMAGARFDRWYAFAGAKVGLNFYGNQIADGRVQLTVTDPQAIEDFTTIYDPIIYDKTKKPLSLELNVAAAAEIGLSLDEWLPDGMKSLNNRAKTPLSYRAGLFVDYGLLNLNKSTTVDPLSIPQNEGGLVADPTLINLASIPESTLANDKRFGNLYAGIKLAVLFQVSKEKKKPVARKPAAKQQQQQSAMFYAQVLDAETHEALDAEVTVRYVSGNRQVFKKTTDNFGFVEHELRAGRYNVNVQADGYNAYKKPITHNKADTLLIALQRVPNFYVHVIDMETRKNLRAEVNINLASDNTPVVEQETDVVSGMMNYELKPGRYQLNVTAEGYIYHQDIIDFAKSDTLLVALQAIKKDVRVVLNNLFFELNKTEIMPESEPALDDLYQFLVKNPSVNIHIVGHTDNTGSLSYNMNLSEGRAKAVLEAIAAKGIDSSRLSFEGRGPNEPVATNDTEEGRAQNRRVEFIIK